MNHHLIARHLRPPGRAIAALVLGFAAAGMAAAASVTVVPVQAANAATTLVVNANQPFRPVTHVASGSLYGLATATVPADSLVEPLHPNTFVQMAAGGHQQAEGDVLVVAPEAARAGAKVIDRMSDYYAGWPYQFSWSSWPGIVQQQVQEVEASGDSNVAAFELWNEPDNTWLSANGTFNDFWVKTYNQVRSLDPGATIQGPSFSDNISGMQSFLANAVATNTVPAIISWHELETSSKIAGDVATVTGIEKSLGITPRPIAIEEYAAPSQVGIPGDLIGYIAQFERLGISNAELAFWNAYGALGDLLTGTGGSPNAAYWLYDWYGAMTGNMVTVTPPGTPGTGLDGAASVNPAGNQVSVIFGGGSGSTAVTINGLSALSAFGGTAQVVLQHVISQGRTTAVAASQIQTTTANYAIINGTITIPVSSMNSADGYRLTITPVANSTGNTVTVTNPGNQAGTVGTAITGLQLHASDSAAGQALTYSATGLPAGMSVSSSGLISGTPTAAGTYSVTVTAADSTGVSGSASFTWTINDTTGGGFPSGYHRLVVGSDSACLDVYGNTTAAGAAIDQWTCNGQSNQQFQFAPVSGGYGELQAQNSGDDVAVSGNSTAQGTPDIVQQPVSGASGSLWKPVQQSDGSWEFQNQNSGLCLDVYGAGSNVGQQLDQWSCKNAPGTNQDFTPN
jgi:hypothetical protein